MDSYQKFIDKFHIAKEDLYEFGLTETIFPPIELIEPNWELLKSKIFSNQSVYIRGYGRDAQGTQLYIDLYNYIFNNSHVTKDPTNNLKAQNLISKLTGYKRNTDLLNYQVSHIFSRTKNIFLFECPWNIVFVPKIIDPFTGHETKGIWPEEYQKLFLEHVKKRYQKFIDDYNQIITSFTVADKIDSYIKTLPDSINTKTIEQFRQDSLNELSTLP